MSMNSLSLLVKASADYCVQIFTTFSQEETYAFTPLKHIDRLRALSRALIHESIYLIEENLSSETPPGLRKDVTFC
jgi:hypothetical protein